MYYATERGQRAWVCAVRAAPLERPPTAPS
jgi:hypothetical protein